MTDVLRDSKIALRPIAEGDTANILKWRNSPIVRENLFSQAEISEKDHLGWMENFVNKGKCHQFIISVVETNMDIGTTFIKNIDVDNQKGEFGIFIGEKIEQGKGYGKRATKLICSYGFEKLQLNKIYLSVFSENISGIKAYENAGFERAGLLRQDVLRNGAFLDVVYMELFRENFEKVKSEDD